MCYAETCARFILSARRSPRLALGAAARRVGAAAAVAPPLQEAGATSFTIFLRGAPIGTEQVAVTRIADGWTIVSIGPARRAARRRRAPRRRCATRRLEAARVHVRRHGPRTVADDSHRRRRARRRPARSPPAASDAEDATRSIRARCSCCRTASSGPYEALAARLRTAAPAPTPGLLEAAWQSFSDRVGESSAEQIQTAARLINARRTRVTHGAAAARRSTPTSGPTTPAG